MMIIDIYSNNKKYIRLHDVEKVENTKNGFIVYQNFKKIYATLKGTKITYNSKIYSYIVVKEW